MTPSGPSQILDRTDAYAQAVAVARAFIVGEVGEDMGKGMTDQAERLVEALDRAGVLAPHVSRVLRGDRVGEGRRAPLIDAVVEALAETYRDPDLARFAINDYRDWRNGHGLSATATEALTSRGLSLVPPLAEDT